MGYESYMRSEAWRTKRDQVLERDGHTCRTCGATEELEVHHASYHHLGDEPLEDLITLCRVCHEAITCSIRERRYAGRENRVDRHCTFNTDQLPGTHGSAGRGQSA